MSATQTRGLNFPRPPQFANLADERRHRKERLAAAFRLFSKFGFDEGVTGHITARDPELTDHFWVNPFGVHYSEIRVSNLMLVNDKGEVVEGKHPLNGAAFAIHSQIHRARPDVIAAAHAHSLYGKAWASLGVRSTRSRRTLAHFYEDHAVFADFTGVVYETSEGERIAKTLGEKKAAILQNHGNLTVGRSVDEAVLVVRYHGEKLPGAIACRSRGQTHSHRSRKRAFNAQTSRQP